MQYKRLPYMMKDGSITQVSEVTRNRSTIIVPAGNAEGDGWAAFRDILIEIDEAQHHLPTIDNISVST